MLGFLLISAAILPCAKSNGYVKVVVKREVNTAAPNEFINCDWLLLDFCSS